MPRKSNKTSGDIAPVRRISARIAAVQAASPVKSPVKSPRRKRRSTELTKDVSEDTESQQSNVKSELSVNEVNGTEETSSSKEKDSAFEVPEKKAKLDEIDNVKCENPKSDIEVTLELPFDHDFEVVEHSAVPSHDSEEVKAAILVQGGNEGLSVGTVQVNKGDLPSNNVEIKQMITETESVNEVVECSKEDKSENCLNGDLLPSLSNDGKTNGTSFAEALHKIPLPGEMPIPQSAGDLASGDVKLDASEVVSQP